MRKDIDPEVKAALAANRDIYKTIITKDIKIFLVSDSADYAQDTADLYPIYRALLRVVQAVERWCERKRASWVVTHSQTLSILRLIY